ncbi:caiB/baiF CoA-transferase protein [Aphelenchoides avenae]|nr:caiB/baiF CoA-transferase protein [Aphelenchus avenae]
MSKSVLDGVKVLDFSRILAAPLASMILRDLGAEVWKIERPGSGDEVRKWVPPAVNGQSCYFLCVNRNKKSIALELSKPQGQVLARGLALKADVLLENFKTGHMSKFGLDYEALSAQNPQLIYLLAYRLRANGTIRFQSGIRRHCGSRRRLHGLYAHGVILAALLQRHKTGQGELIHCNLLSTQITALANIASNYLNAGVEGRPWGTEHESIVPFKAFRTKNGRHYVVGAGDNDAFREVAWASGTPASPVNTVGEAFAHEQVHHLGLVQYVIHPSYGRVNTVPPPKCARLVHYLANIPAKYCEKSSAFRKPISRLQRDNVIQ